MDISSHVMGIESGGLGASNNIFFNIYFLIRITDGFTDQKYRRCVMFIKTLFPLGSKFELNGREVKRVWVPKI